MGDGHIAARTECYANVRSSEGRRVVGTVANKGNDLTPAFGLLQCSDVFRFLMRQNVGANIGNGNAKLQRNAASGSSVVASAHMDGQIMVML